MNEFVTKHRTIILSAAIAALSMMVFFLTAITTPTKNALQEREITVDNGQGAYSIADELKEQGLIRSSNLFVLYVHLRGWDSQLQAGDYSFPAGSALATIASMIAHGEAVSDDIKVIIKEGFNIWEVDQALADVGLIQAGTFARTYHSQDGYLFPDTYRFRLGSTLAEIAQKMQTNFKSKTKNVLGHLTPAEQKRIIIVAAILEKEAKKESDMRLVSGVIKNRMDRKMPLEIDATVTYGTCLRISLARNFSRNCDVTQIGVANELKIDSAYNTYARQGLPVGPISNPGLVAINAVTHPTGDYIYYLSTRDGSQIIFSRTSAEHSANRKKYLGL
ncbi:endolytic transglycosylase MltG [Candidatus Parcubacteria bacterium]|nr:endolytic transglycosylase MltG [Candidatus Parcubacteria bacterium]